MTATLSARGREWAQAQRAKRNDEVSPHTTLCFKTMRPQRPFDALWNLQSLPHNLYRIVPTYLDDYPSLIQHQVPHPPDGAFAFFAALTIGVLGVDTSTAQPSARSRSSCTADLVRTLGAARRLPRALW